ncbi:MAG: FtsX-like permease family protein [Gemmatimonas sp.]|nr:FtsX-like permease family protein [Gemmatimonas sp.]
MRGAGIRWITLWRNRLRAVLNRDAVESELDDELAYHLELEIEENLRSGMPLAEARRQARIAFGGMEKHKEGVRDARTFGWLTGAALDLKLAWRLLIKSPGMTVVGGLGIAVAVAIGTLFFSVQDMILHSTLPFEEGERVVALEVHADTGLERRILYEFALWRQELTSVEEIGAWRPATRTLVVAGGGAGPVQMVEMSASGFRLARLPARLGRTVLEEDELGGAPAGAVISSGVWRTYFSGDPDVVGREIRLGTVPYTVVGVMPQGFAFPVNHELWVPLRTDRTPAAPRAGPLVSVFGRLAPGATMESAAAELATLGQRMTAAYAGTHARLRPRLLPYTKQGLDARVTIVFGVAQTLTILLLVVICVNIAVLVHARTTARTGEIAVRSALGASRLRIIGQLFAEALALTLGAALAGLAIAAVVLEVAANALEEQGPLSFWMQLGLSPAAVLYALALAVAGAAIVGVIPALKATGRQLRSGIDGSGRTAGLRLGRIWTVQIVVQVAIASAIFPAATFGAWEFFQSGLTRPQFPAAEFLTGRLDMETEAAGNEGGRAAEVERAARFDDRVRELTTRLEADPSVAHVTFAKQSVGNSLPGTVVIEDLPRAPDEPRTSAVRALEVDLDVFEGFGIPVLEGQGFRPGDLAEGATAVVVNRAFVEDVLGGRNAVGREMRYTAPPRLSTGVDTLRRYQIVGVVGNQLVVSEDPLGGGRPRLPPDYARPARVGEPPRADARPSAGGIRASVPGAHGRPRSHAPASRGPPHGRRATVEAAHLQLQWGRHRHRHAKRRPPLGCGYPRAHVLHDHASPQGDRHSPRPRRPPRPAPRRYFLPRGGPDRSRPRCRPCRRGPDQPHRGKPYWRAGGDFHVGPRGPHGGGRTPRRPRACAARAARSADGGPTDGVG